MGYEIEFAKQCDAGLKSSSTICIVPSELNEKEPEVQSEKRTRGS